MQSLYQNHHWVSNANFKNNNKKMQQNQCSGTRFSNAHSINTFHCDLIVFNERTSEWREKK